MDFLSVVSVDDRTWAGSKKSHKDPCIWTRRLSLVLYHLPSCSLPARMLCLTPDLRNSPHHGKNESLRIGFSTWAHTAKRKSNNGERSAMSKLVEDKCDDIRDLDELRMMSEARLDYIYTQDVRP
ncbi:unnamed protein product [Victoria cruziana]